jgi:hypothetical protein
MVEYFSNEAILTYTPINVPSTIKVKKIKYHSCWNNTKSNKKKHRSVGANTSAKKLLS